MLFRSALPPFPETAMTERPGCCARTFSAPAATAGRRTRTWTPPAVWRPWRAIRRIDKLKRSCFADCPNRSQRCTAARHWAWTSWAHGRPAAFEDGWTCCNRYRQTAVFARGLITKRRLKIMDSIGNSKLHTAAAAVSKTNTDKSPPVFAVQKPAGSFARFLKKSGF